jgi:diaminopimelate decarboxylase
VKAPFAVSVNEHGHLTIAGHDAVSLADRFGTPLYVLSEQAVRDQCRAYRSAVSAADPRGEVVYAAKALLNTTLARILDEEGLHIDVVSGGELHTALVAGFPAERLHFNGNAKTAAEIEFAVQSGVGRLIIDNFGEIELIDRIATAAGRRVRAKIRVCPGVEAHTHEYVQTGITDSKFGFNYIGGQAYAAAARVVASQSIDLVGLQCHLGSQILDLEPWGAAAEVMLTLADEIRHGLGCTIDELDLGGGLGIRYVAGDNPPPVSDLIAAMAAKVQAISERIGFPQPRLIVEPGRSIVGEAGYTLHRVQSLKEIPNVRRYVAVDGGMADNIRPALYGAEYTLANASRMSEHEEQRVTVAGRCCESGDIIARDVMLAAPQIGDVLVTFSTGAYCFSMASNYNRLPRPAMVLIGDGTADLIVARQTYDDMVAGDRIPARMQARREVAAAKSS